MAEADDICFILLIDAHLDFPNILNYLCTNLELPVAGLGLAVERRSRLLLEAVATRARHNQSVALLVDDAQQLAAEVLLHLQEFVETPAIPSQRLQVVLAALPDLARTLDQPELCRLRDSIQVHCHLERLSELQTGLFIEHQLKLAGHAGGSLLPPAAIERINYSLQGSAPRHRPPVRHGLPVCQLAVGTCYHPGVGGYSRSDLLSRRAVQLGYPDRGWPAPRNNRPRHPTGSRRRTRRLRPGSVRFRFFLRFRRTDDEGQTAGTGAAGRDGHAERGGCPTSIAVGRGTCRDRSRTEDRRALF